MNHQPMPSLRPLKKIVAQLEPDSWHGHATETLWAERVNEGRYRLRSVPFFARGLSVEDVVTTRFEDDIDVVTGVSLHGGHSTYRVFLSDGTTLESSSFSEHWQPLADLGCTYERATERLLAIDIPPSADLHRAYELLGKGETAGVWDFEEGSVSPNAKVANPKT
jgi:hypothetical protein